MSAPTVSVLLPTHNRPAWLRQALCSVLDGEWRDLEVVVSNNGRLQDTRELAAEVGDPRVRWLEAPGASLLDNWRNALGAARGRFVAPLHDDDWWDPRLLATIIPPLVADDGLAVAFAEAWEVDAGGTIDPEGSRRLTATRGRDTLAPGAHRPFHPLVVRGSVPLPGSAFRRDRLPVEAYPAQVGPALDFWTFHLLASTGLGAYHCPERLVYCRAHASSDFAAQPVDNLLCAVRVGEAMLREPGYDQCRDELQALLAGWQWSIGRAALHRGSRRDARSHLRAALSLRPSARVLGGWAASWLLPGPVLRHI
ncbi:MAG: glycosyltransferase family 2 protein [Solirubrobacterales bacterium]|nr:glycosyltransferase family 2 protein [Solirubrobacterales bacterium]